VNACIPSNEEGHNLDLAYKKMPFGRMEALSCILSHAIIFQRDDHRMVLLRLEDLDRLGEMHWVESVPRDLITVLPRQGVVKLLSDVRREKVSIVERRDANDTCGATTILSAR
jgi:hypothetical protein